MCHHLRLLGPPWAVDLDHSKKDLRDRRSDHRHHHWLGDDVGPVEAEWEGDHRGQQGSPKLPILLISSSF